MLSFLRKYRKAGAAGTVLCLVLSLGILLGYFTNHVWNENGRFQDYSQKIFRNEVSGNMLTLHYTLADPEQQGIKKPVPSLGSVSSDQSKSMELCREYLKNLKSFDSARLSTQNRLTLDMLLLYFQTQLSAEGASLLDEMLSPSLGIQAQLPVVLAEYTFREDQDIADYLNLLVSIKPYFESILKFQQEKSAAGYFMSDTTLDRILKQCRAFIKNPDSNYMLEIFEQKLKDYGKFSEESQKQLIRRHKEILKNNIIPAYQELINGLEALRGTGKNSGGLANLEGGQNYYIYLIRSQSGVYDSAGQIQNRLVRQLKADLKTMQMMLKEQPSLLRKLSGGTDLSTFKPEEALAFLRKKSSGDFPGMEQQTDYQVRYVHKSMEDYLSPAFYLTPPVDTGNPNVIYINSASKSTNLELFGTLSHEGFPGHLYQTVYFGSQKPSGIRYLLSSFGYTEGWATYVESFGYSYASDWLEDPAASDLTALAWLNRSVNLCLYSLMDIGIHYQGWSLSAASGFLNAFGITDTGTISEIYQYIVETPANYLKYYLGYLNFLDLREEWQTALGDSFNLKEFHQNLLEIGPVQFPVLQKYMRLALNSGSDS